MNTANIISTLVLASASPRRLQLLQQMGVVPEKIVPADIEETPGVSELPIPYALRMAREKATAVAVLHADAYVLGSDTVVACGRRILPKTETASEARKCLELLSGRRHRVVTAVALVYPGGAVKERVVTTVVTFKKLTEKEIADYIMCEEWKGVAGGYAIQGQAAALIRYMGGSHSAVVGLPLHETYQLLNTAKLVG